MPEPFATLTPLNFLAMLRSIYPVHPVGMILNSTELHPRESLSFKVHLFFMSVFPSAKGFYDGERFLTKIGDEWFDIDGRIDEETAQVMTNLQPLTSYEELRQRYADADLTAFASLLVQLVHAESH